MFAGPFVDKVEDTATDDVVERNGTRHEDEVWTARLLMPHNSYTALDLTWDEPNLSTISSNNRLCAFRLHYYPGTSADRGKHRERGHSKAVCC